MSSPDFHYFRVRGLLTIFEPRLESELKLDQFVSSFDDICSGNDLSIEDGAPGSKFLDRHLMTCDKLECVVFPSLISFMEKRPECLGLLNDLQCVGVMDKPHYDAVLCCAEELVDRLSPKAVIGSLIQMRLVDQEMASMALYLPDKIANCLILRKLPLKHPGWFSEFKKLLHSVELDSLINKIEDFYAQRPPSPEFDKESLMSSSSLSYTIISSDTVTDYSMLDDADDWLAPDKSNPPLYMQYGSSVWEGAAIDDLVQEIEDLEIESRGQDRELILRPYQEELVERAMQGANVIICAPTGSGKTYAVVPIIKRALTVKPDKKVAFFAPVCELVRQQANVVERHLGSQYKILAMSGSDSNGGGPRAISLRNANVIVMTPVIFINMLRAPEADSVDIMDFSLFVFDECHHTDKLYPYSDIMISYFDHKLDAGASSAQLPQIVGLTASVGVGKANTIQNAREHIMNMSARLDAQYLEIVEKNVADLLASVPRPKDDVIFVEAAHDWHPFSVIIQGIMSRIEARLKPLIAQKIELVKLNIPMPETRYSTDYTSFLGQMKGHIPQKTEKDMCSEMSTYLNHLQVYHDALILNAHVPTKQALQFVESRMEKFQKHSESSWDRWTWALFKEKETQLRQPGNQPLSPLPERLCHILREAYRSQTDARTIVFVERKLMTIMLAEFINSDPSLASLRAERLVSSNSKVDLGGQTSAQQKDILDRFRTGDCKVLLATTIGEEGLDIELCNLVIKYNHVTNETAMIQRRGRGRAHDSRSILLTQEAQKRLKEEMNIGREEMMVEAIKIIKLSGQENFLNEVQIRQKEEFNERKLLDRVKSTSDCATSAIARCSGRWMLVCCKHCDNQFCRSTHIRRVENSSYVIVLPEIKTQLIEREIEVNQTKLSCAKCKKEVGSTVKHRGTYFPQLSIKTLKFKNPDPKADIAKTGKKWADVDPVVFAVADIRDEDINRMMQSRANYFQTIPRTQNKT